MSWKALSTTNAIIAEASFDPVEATVVDVAGVKADLKPLVVLKVKLASDQGFTDLYNALTMPHSTLPNIGALELSVDDDYREKLERRYLDYTNDEQTNEVQARSGLDLLTDMLQNLGPETKQMSTFKISNMHLLPPEQKDIARAVGSITTLNTVELWDCRVEEEAALILGEALAKNPKMKKLDLAKNHLGADVKTKIENMFKGNGAIVINCYD